MQFVSKAHVAMVSWQQRQAWAPDDPDDDNLAYIQVACLARAQAHLVNPKTGKVLGA